MGAHRLTLQQRFQFELAAQTIGRADRQRLLGQIDGAGGLRGHFCGDAHGFGHQIRIGQDLPHQTVLQRFAC